MELTLRLNRAYERITGISASELIGKNVLEIEDENMFLSQRPPWSYRETEPVTISQEMRTGQNHFIYRQPGHDESGNIFRVVCNVRDITELNMLKEKLEKK